ncbi:MAG: flagellar basal-body rod protein FlgF [Betaproteobacteria bacterium]|nr:flagellar basal-body rod protein FlgF [Betaproteobacteria bacterium]
MDRMIYIAMNGAKHSMQQQAVTAHNLANVSTTGYKAEANAFRALPVLGDGLQTRTFVVDSTTGADLSAGAIQSTGRDLDVAVQGKGWIAVQAADGSEAYTRDGSLQVGSNGLLQTRNGLQVIGDGGPIAVQADAEITIGKDGTISIIPMGQTPNTVATVGRIKLVNPPEADLAKSGDGLFRLKSGLPAPSDASVGLMQKSLETSNVSVVDSLVSMISLSRQFDMQMKLLQSAESNAGKASQLMNLNA